MAGVAGYGAGHGPQKRDDRPWSSYIPSPIKGLENLLPSLAPGGQRKEMPGPHDHLHDILIQAQPKTTQREIDEDWESVQAPKDKVELETLRNYHTDSLLRFADLERRVQIAEQSALLKESAITDLMKLQRQKSGMKKSKGIHDVDGAQLIAKIDEFQKIEEQFKSDLEQKEEQRYQATQQVIALNNKLAIATAEAELYKEDFENERKDREKAHDLKEEMRFAFDEKVHAMAKERQAFEETIKNLTRKLEGISNEKEEIRATRTSTRQHELLQNDKQIHELQEQLYEARQKAITAQEEVQAKTAQVKQYKKKDDQREEKLISLDARNQELCQEMERVRSELEKTKFELEEKDRKSSTERDSDTFRDELKKIKKKVDRLEKKATSGGTDYQHSPFVPVPVPQTDPINFQQIDSQGRSVYHDNSPQGHYQDRYQNQPQPRNVPPSNHPSQWPNQQPYLQDHLYQQQPDEQYEHPFSQRQSFQWDNTSSQERMESQHYPNRRSPHNYPRSLSYPAHISSQEDSSLSSTSLSESPNPLYSPTQVAMLPPPQARPRPKPRKANRKLSQQKEENELEKGLSTEIKKIVGDLYYQQYESEKQQTNEHVPLDPNLVCRVCSKQHRLGEIQKYRKHVKECEREQGVRAEEAAAKLASDTKPFSIKHSTDPRD